MKMQLRVVVSELNVNMIFKPSNIRLIIIGHLSFHFYIAINNNRKSHRYCRIPKLLCTLIFLAIMMAMIISVFHFHLNRSYLPSHSSLLSNYANFLRTKYKSIVNPKWPPLSSELYILLDHFPTKMLSLFLIIISTITRAIK